jgi:hypothetical protein
MTAAERVFKDGFAPQWGDSGLRLLADACRDFDPRLVQGVTCRPSVYSPNPGTPVESCDLVGFVGLAMYDHVTTGALEEFFAGACFEADNRTGEPAACRWLLNWWDDAEPVGARRDLYRWCWDVLSARGVYPGPADVFPQTVPPHVTDSHRYTGPCPF